MVIFMLFKDKLKELRKKKNISQYDLAKELNISRSVVAKWETGLTLPNEELVNALVEYFGIKRDELFSNEETENLIVKKNNSITKLKKIVICLTSILLVIILAICISNINFAKPLSKDLNKLGNLDEVKVYLYDGYADEYYLLDSSHEEFQEKLLNDLSMVKYKTYPKRMRVEPFVGQYSIVLEGSIKIIINRSFIIVDNKNIVVKKYSGNNVDSLIEHLTFKLLTV